MCWHYVSTWVYWGVAGSGMVLAELGIVVSSEAGGVVMYSTGTCALTTVELVEMAGDMEGRTGRVAGVCSARI